MHRISGEISPQGASENLRTQQRTELRSAAGKFKQHQALQAAQRLPLRRRPVGAHPTRSVNPADPPSVSALPNLPQPISRDIDTHVLHQDADNGKDLRP